MFIDRYVTSSPTPFGGAEVNWTFATQVRSAPSNGADGVFGFQGHRHLTPSGVKTNVKVLPRYDTKN
jgi:hypothetical protein